MLSMHNVPWEDQRQPHCLKEQYRNEKINKKAPQSQKCDKQ